MSRRASCGWKQGLHRCEDANSIFKDQKIAGLICVQDCECDRVARRRPVRCAHAMSPVLFREPRAGAGVGDRGDPQISGRRARPVGRARGIGSGTRTGRLRNRRSAEDYRRCGGGRSGADAEVCIPGLAGLRPAPCVARRAPLNPLHRTRRHAVLRSFQQHRRPATTLRVGWSSDLSLGSTRTRRLRERPSSSASPKGPRAVLRCALSTEAPETGSTGSVLSPGKRRLTRKSGAAYTAPPDAVRKKNGAGRTDFPRFRKVDLAKAKVLDFSSKGNYESDY
ncbi:hypothetical protein ABIC70_005124 [Methylobacterium sp. 1973]